MTRVAAIVFDLDQTLFDRQLAFDGWIASLAVSSRDRMRLRELDQNGYGNRESFFAACQSITDETIDQRRFANSLLKFVRPERTLIDCLRHLRAAHPLAILTNGGAATQNAKIQTLSLDQVVPPGRIFVSSEIGFSKPDRRAFDLVAGTFGVPANECLYFGDSMETDVIAARAAGWKACHVRGPLDLQQKLRRLREAAAC